MIEFEIPFVCLIFTTVIALEFFTKKKVKIKENYYYKSILIFTLLVNTTNFVSHYLASIYAKDGLTAQFQSIFAFYTLVLQIFVKTFFEIIEFLL